jgi:Holliday junction resolvase RusA-like endonuclease
MIFHTKPVPKPRMTRRDKWAKRDCVVNYYSFKDELKLQGRNYELPDAFGVVFGVPFPRSYSLKKREQLLGQPHQVKPDIDNYLKALMDVFKDNDSSVWKIEARKIWTSGDGFIEITDLENNEAS